VLLGQFHIMNRNKILGFGIAAAAVVLVASLGTKFLARSTIDAPTVTPSAMPQPRPFTQLLGRADLGRRLAGTTYRVASPFAVPFEITLPPSRLWTLWTVDSFRSPFHGDVRFRASSGLVFFGAYVVVDLIENVFADPCHIDSGPMDPPPVPTVDGFVESLTRMVNITAGPVSDVRIGQHVAKAFVLTYATDGDPADCTGEGLHLWTLRGGGTGGTIYGGGFAEHIWVVNVGGTIVVIDGETFETTSDLVKHELQRILESITFD
jgi:hypothetical protein